MGKIYGIFISRAICRGYPYGGKGIRAGGYYARTMAGKYT
jgi:hypothetical protein